MRFLILTALLAFAPLLKAAEIEFAESVPAETVYGSTLAARPAGMWVDMINGAQKTLDFEEFYIADKPGEALSPVIAAVKAAAARGVKVRFIVEKAMMRETAKALPGLTAEKNIKARVINFKKLAGGGVQHSKFFIVDGKEVYVGSQNFDWRSLVQIHETGARIKSERAARDFAAVFEADWAAGDKEKPEKQKFAAVKDPLNSSAPEEATVGGGKVSYHLAFGPDRYIPKGFDTELGELLRLINGAKKTVRGQVMTYSLKGSGKKNPKWTDLDDAFRAAGARGVKVELVFSDWAVGGKADADIKSLAQAKNVSVRISSLPRYSKAFVPFARVEHCKYLVADGEKAFLSTSNWARDYFLETRGAAVVLEGAAGAAPLEDIFSRAWNGPYVQPVDPEKQYEAVKKQ